MRRIRLRPHLPVFAAILTALTIPPAASAACGEDEEVKITVVVILATPHDDKIDAILVCLANEVRKECPELTGFRAKACTNKSVVVGREDTFDLVEGKSAVVTVRRGTDTKNWVCLKVKVLGVGDIDYRCALCGKFLPIVTSYQTMNDETLIIAISVDSCKAKK